MRVVTRLLLVLTAGLLVGAVITACAGQQQGGNQGGGGQQQTQQLDITKVTESWVKSLHSVPVTFAAEEAPCAGCHDGKQFASGDTTPGELVVSTDCRACHSGRGAELISSGEVTITTTSETINASTGAVCLACHRELGPPSLQDPEKRGPHPSSQGGVWRGTGGFKEGMSLKSTRPHATMKKACVTCHYTRQSWGPDHSLEVDFQKACGRSGCHDNVTDAPNLPAKADYDGNGQTEGIQTEIGNLQAILTSATLAEANATTLTETEGRIVFKSGDATVTSFSNDVYQAAYNLLLTEVDGSQGVHNPAYVASLLQQTYRQLTGREITGAVAPK